MRSRDPFRETTEPFSSTIPVNIAPRLIPGRVAGSAPIP